MSALPFGKVFLQYVYTVKMFKIVFSFYVKDNNIFPCLHNTCISNFYNIKQCFSALSIRMRMST